MKRIGLFAGALVVVLAVPIGAVDQPDPQRPQPTIVNEPDGQRVTIGLSDPDRPGTVDMHIVMGSITIKGVNRKDIAIDGRGVSNPPRRRGPDEPPPPGLRRLTQSGSFTVDEDRNTVSVDVDTPTRAINFTVEVPVHTNIQVETVMGSVSVEGVDGELEVNSVNGEVTLANVSGCVVAHSVNGKLVATVTKTTPQQPMAFTSLNGNVDVTLPAAVKANLKLRSDQGDVYTDFDLQLQREPVRADNNVRRNGSRTEINFNHSVYGSVNGGGPDYEIRTFNGNVYVRKGK